MKVKKKYRPSLRAISSVLGNLSAGWFTVAMITPNFADLNTPDGVRILTGDIFLGILFLFDTIVVEELLES